jgi:hypothetical protein
MQRKRGTKNYEYLALDAAYPNHCSFYYFISKEDYKVNFKLRHYPIVVWKSGAGLLTSRG